MNFVSPWILIITMVTLQHQVNGAGHLPTKKKRLSVYWNEWLHEQAWVSKAADVAENAEFHQLANN